MKNKIITITRDELIEKMLKASFKLDEDLSNAVKDDSSMRMMFMLHNTALMKKNRRISF